MATYKGMYLDDFGNIQLSARLEVYLFNVSNNTVTRTPPTYDVQYLPQVFLNNSVLILLRERVCIIDYRIRFARLWLTPLEYLRVDLPFRPNTTMFNEFFTQLSQNNSVNNWGYRGEIIPYFQLTNKRRLHP